MGYTEFGELGSLVRSGTLMEARNLKSGEVTSEQLIIAGGTKGVIRSQNYVPASTGWAAFGDGTLDVENLSARGTITLPDDSATGADIIFDNEGIHLPAYASFGIPEIELNRASIQWYKASGTPDPDTIGAFVRALDDGAVGYFTVIGDVSAGDAPALNLRAEDDLAPATVHSWLSLWFDVSNNPRATLSLDNVDVFDADDTAITFGVPIDLEGNTDIRIGPRLTTRFSFSEGGTIGFEIDAGAGQVFAADGSSTVPSYTFLNDPDTGVFSPSAGGYGIIIDGTQNLTVTEITNGTRLAFTKAAGTWIEATRVSTVDKIFINGNDGIDFEIAENLQVWITSNQAFNAKTKNGGNIHLGYSDGNNYITSDSGTGGSGDTYFRHFNGTSYSNMFVFTDTKRIESGGDSDTYFEMATANQIKAYAGNSQIWIIGTSGFHTNFAHNLGNTSGLFIGEDFADIGNHETLRANRTSGGTGTTEVGYFSSWIKDPDTGKVKKHRIRQLAKEKGEWWDRSWFMDIEPIKYERVIRTAMRPVAGPTDTKAARKKRPLGYRPIEIGFSIENLIQHTNLLTTKGSLVGNSPDEYALLAVTVDYVQHLERRVAALEDALR